jgi:hypothetical protein
VMAIGQGVAKKVLKDNKFTSLHKRILEKARSCTKAFFHKSVLVRSL